MIPDELEQRILRLHFVERWKVGTIAKQVGVHHTTVDRVLRAHGVTRPVQRRPSMVDPFLPFIHETLEQYPTLPASRLHAMVAERGYPGGPDHFRGVIARLRPKKPAEAFLRTLPGEEAQVDRGHFGKVQIGWPSSMILPVTGARSSSPPVDAPPDRPSIRATAPTPRGGMRTHEFFGPESRSSPPHRPRMSDRSAPESISITGRPAAARAPMSALP